MINYVWLIPLFPAIAVLINGIFGKKYIKEKSHYLAVGSVGLSFLVTLPIFFEVVNGKTLNWNLYEWIPSGNFLAPVGFLVDPLSAVMLLVVTSVGFLIHIYSVGYMHGDPGYYRFFTYLNLFMFSMLILVLANNYLLLYVGWEAVGLCSYLLIGFWFEKKSAADAGKKAFIVNRIGDFGFGLAVMWIFVSLGTLNYTEVFESAEKLSVATATGITLLLFLGACGKSAQIPLYVWLPDAMEGPTPVSALIHAATMVTAGVYMVARSNVLFTMAPISMEIVALVGAATAILAASIGLVQNDIKRVMAYSTVSQLGYMFLALGVGAFTAGIFHLMTHAFFKALLFLGAGSVIHAMAGEQNIQKMGGLAGHMKITAGTLLVASLALSGIPPFAGFWSKDEILWHAFKSGNYLVYILGAITALMTAFYVFRMYILTFLGKSRVDHHTAHHLHESPYVMTIPLVFLAIGSLFAGFMAGFPPEKGFIHKFLAPVFKGGHSEGLKETAHESVEFHFGPMDAEQTMMLISIIVAIAGISIAWFLYSKRPEIPKILGDRFSGLYKLLYNKYYVDEIYNYLIVQPIIKGSEWFFAFDAWVIDGIVNGVARLTVITSFLSTLHDEFVVDGSVNAIAYIIRFSSLVFRKLQTGLVQRYALVMALGLVIIVGIFVFF